jgi:NADH-quinone oxidoreductase subunit M
MIGFPLLSLMTFLPLIGVLFLFTIRSDEKDVMRNVKWTTLWISGFVFACSLYLLIKFEASQAGFQFVEDYMWLKELDIGYRMGVDGISLFFVVLSAFLTFICVIACWNVKTRLKEFMALFLVLETLMIGTFCALDLFVFYIFFEGVLIPMFLIIGIWGGDNRVYASYKFFLFTLLGSLFMLVSLIYLYNQFGTSDMRELTGQAMEGHAQYWLWLGVFASFAVKMPMWPVHTWLPDAHVQAPTAGSVILAGVLLKMGGYGFLRLSLPMFPEASEFFAPMVYWLSVIAILYASVVALVQTDMKKLIAYSSVAHMGYVTLGIFSANLQGVQGAIFQMISHGIISGALFLCVGVVYDRLHTREIDRYGGIVQNMPRYATLFMIFMLGSVGLPGTSGFVGEFLALLGGFKADPWVAAFAALGLIYGAAYMLMLYRRMIFGKAVHKDAMRMPDVSMREAGILGVLAGLVIFLGVFPNVVLDKTEPSVKALIALQNGTISSTGELAP